MRIVIRYFFRLLVLFDAVHDNWEKLTTPKGVDRSEEDRVVNEQCKSPALYQFKTRPFCIKVRKTIARLSLPIGPGMPSMIRLTERIWSRWR